ncbi:MFS transporter [Ramlibacter albus]|uniref:MFS transporter n=1 Tax=Ramlibacter albus TaxID=2079448 RepID=A0A923M6V6_9BURK|nr:MFS transporter [Ramlibacter albus]MBC5764928.1 MFS transporter [Ramlibacter albus]
MELFRHPAFIRYWAARVTGGAANQVLLLAIGWHMYQLTGSAWDLGMVGLLQFAPSIAVALPSGHLADRVNRLRIVQVCQAAHAAAALIMAVATLRGWISPALLYGVSILLGTVRPFQMAASTAIIPALVPTELLPRATAFAAAGFQASTIAGPAIGGLLFVAGLDVVYATCAGVFTVATLLLFGVRYEHVPPPREPVTMQSLLAGLSFIGANKVLLGAVTLDLFAVLLGGATALLPIYAQDILHVGPEGLGMLRAAPAMGALVVAVALARKPLARHVGRKLMVSVAAFGVFIVVFGVSRNFWLSMAALAASGAADMVSVVVRQTLVQLETPDAMRGRVAAVSSLFIGASNQLGEFESGATAALMGPVASVVVGGVGTVLVAAAWAKLFKGLAGRDRFA